jgi:hypothetical protein
MAQAKRSIMDMEAALHDVRRIAHLIEIIGYALPEGPVDDKETSEALVMVGWLLLDKQRHLMEIWEEVR